MLMVVVVVVGRTVVRVEVEGVGSRLEEVTGLTRLVRARRRGSGGPPSLVGGRLCLGCRDGWLRRAPPPRGLKRMMMTTTTIMMWMLAMGVRKHLKRPW